GRQGRPPSDGRGGRQRRPPRVGGRGRQVKPRRVGGGGRQVKPRRVGAGCGGSQRGGFDGVLGRVGRPPLPLHQRQEGVDLAAPLLLVPAKLGAYQFRHRGGRPGGGGDVEVEGLGGRGW